VACRRKSFGANEGTTGARRATINADCWIAITGVHQIAVFADAATSESRFCELFRAESRLMLLQITTCSSDFRNLALLHV
jgi:hypothetical protein